MLIFPLVDLKLPQLFFFFLPHALYYLRTLFWLVKLMSGPDKVLIIFLPSEYPDYTGRSKLRLYSSSLCLTICIAGADYLLCDRSCWGEAAAKPPKLQQSAAHGSQVNHRRRAECRENIIILGDPGPVRRLAFCHNDDTLASDREHHQKSAEPSIITKIGWKWSLYSGLYRSLTLNKLGLRHGLMSDHSDDVVKLLGSERDFSLWT